MFQIYSKDSNVLIDVNSRLPVKLSVYPFTWFANDENNSVLLAQHLQAKLSDHMKGIRAEAYEQGFRDAKSKRKYQDWFSGDC